MKLVRQRDDWLLLALAAACLALAYVFARVGSEVLEGEMASVDQAVRRWVVTHRAPVLVAFFRGVTLLGAKEVLIPLSIVIGWRMFRRSWALIALLVFASAASAEFVALLKRNYQVRRPAGGLAVSLGLSFPSGHAAGSTAVALVLSYIAVRRRVAPKLVVSVGALVVLLVGFSRVYLDVHWASDVVGGWLVGAAFGIGCCALYEWVHRRAGGHPERSEGSTRNTGDPSLRSE